MHTPPSLEEPTPIYDQLMDETYGQIVHNLTYNGRQVRVKVINKDTSDTTRSTQ
ncbi:Uncharacterised protein [Corynebacterium imitans]|uniref:Uncharacterized protein n=1 Tax=Corynebacterium imitans TaxID=156978 RepID=A0A239ZI89_9CORY|nr:hypothetical protein [Corynebacterium imitans]SNV70607.1 Uncharacterised protein [Corynebacterium imitans]